MTRTSNGGHGFRGCNEFRQTIQMPEEVENCEYPLVSIVVPNWNGMAFLEKCLQSLMSLTYPKYEVIVVDNGSSDGSTDFVRVNFKGVRLIANDRNLGFAKGSNIGIRASRGGMIVLLNNDVVVDPVWLSELVKATVASPKIGVASGIILRSKSSDVVWSAGNRIDAFTGYHWRVDYGKKLREVRDVDDIDYMSACALLAKREVVERIGLLDEGYFFSGEDADWILRARKAGYEFRLVVAAIAWHEGSATSRTVMKERYYWNSKSNFRFLFKNFPLGYLFTALFFQLILSPLFEVLFARRPSAYLLLKFKAFAWNIANLPRTMFERKKVKLAHGLDLKQRFRECMQVALARVRSRCYDF